MTYLFIGPPASGKGTQAKLLAEHLQIPYFSIGSLLREASERDPEINNYIDNGQLVPDSVVIGLLHDLHKKHPDNVIIDGAIRTTAQVDTVLSIWDTAKVAVINLELPDHLILERASKRVEGGHKRDDDGVAIVEKRIAYYHQTIGEILHHLKSHGIRVIDCNGNNTVEAVQQEIQDKV